MLPINMYNAKQKFREIPTRSCLLVSTFETSAGVWFCAVLLVSPDDYRSRRNVLVSRKQAMVSEQNKPLLTLVFVGL